MLIEKLYTRMPTDDRFYFTGKPCVNGHVADRYKSSRECVECRKEKNLLLKEKQVVWGEKNRERKNAISKQNYHSNVEKERERSRKKYSDNPEKVRATNNAWAKKNPKIWNHYGSLRRAIRRERTPQWADLKAIKEIYAACPPGYHVDHIIPLQGNLVSGLHVEGNLQYLLATENQRKFNRFEVS